MMGQTPDAPNPPGDPVDTKRPRQSGPNGQLDANGDFVPEIMLLAECPHCRYALRGLPIAHYCPECGQPVDRQWKVIGAPQDQPGPAWQRYIIAALKWYLIAHIALTMLSFARQSNLAAFAIFALCVAILWQIWRVSTARGFVAVGPRGLHIHRGRSRGQDIPWHELGRAHFDILKQSVMVEHRGGRLRLRASRYFGGSAAQGDYCVRTINAFPRPINDASSDGVDPPPSSSQPPPASNSTAE
jgi:hypothetical protein